MVSRANGTADHVMQRFFEQMGRRAAAARMFVREPRLLVFDDLSSVLDGEVEATGR